MEVICKMGHTDTIVIADSGLPIPDHVRRIDLALIQGVPGLLQVLDALLDTYQCESYVLANEIKETNQLIENGIKERLSNITAEYISHDEFKLKCGEAKAVIRTGECTPYANIILKSGVTF